jgi:hypothetical protein
VTVHFQTKRAKRVRHARESEEGSIVAKGNNSQRKEVKKVKKGQAAKKK